MKLNTVGIWYILTQCEGWANSSESHLILLGFSSLKSSCSVTSTISCFNSKHLKNFKGIIKTQRRAYYKNLTMCLNEWIAACKLFKISDLHPFTAELKITPV